MVRCLKNEAWGLIAPTVLFTVIDSEGKSLEELISVRLLAKNSHLTEIGYSL